jgi:4-amino-4-deoxychorismate lyase
VEGALRLVCTRGVEDSGEPTVFAYVFAVNEATKRARREGLRIATASLGLPADLRASSPWLLGGAKTLSYAVNMASQRWAQAQGADDVLWVSSDGFALEAPTATLIWLHRDVLSTVPTSTGIIAGTTARYLLDHAGELGWQAGERLVRPAELSDAHGAWLASSVRGVVAITVLDGVQLPLAPQAGARMSALLGYT